MKWGVCSLVAVLLVLSVTIAFGAPVEVIGDLNVTSNSAASIGVDRFTNELGGIYFRENSTLQWIFPFIRGWQSDNLIVRDETALLDVMTFQAGTGNVGVGISNPQTKFDVNGWIRARNGYGDSISIGGDNVNGDLEILISAPAERNKISLWNSQLQSGVDLGVKSISTENLNITGNITTAPKVGYLSISPYAFHLVNNQYSSCAMSTDSSLISNQDYIYYAGGVLQQWCDAYAPVTLPHGATITKFTSYWWYNVDAEPGATADFRRGRFSEGNYYSYMASTEVNGRFNGVREASDTTIQNPVVDNQNYNYQVNITIYEGSETDAQFYGAVIEYTYTSP